MSNPSRLLIIGIDGADYRMINRWITSGAMPSLARLAERGALLPCRSTVPAVSWPAWTTVLTGCDPGKHGVYDFYDFTQPERCPWWTLPRGGGSLFRRLSDAAITCGAVNVPMTYPAEPINGAMISGFGSPAQDEQAFYPRGLRDDLLRLMPDYELTPSLGPGLWPPLETVCGYAKMQARAAALVLERHQLEVLMVVLNTLDWVGHMHGDPEADGGRLTTAAAAIDQQVAELVARTDWPRTPVLVVSDHGIRPTTRQVDLPKLFLDLGLVRLRTLESRSAATVASVSLLLKTWHRAKRLLPSGIVAGLRRLGKKPRRALVRDTLGAVVDWSQTVATPVGLQGLVRLNVIGREPNGSVPRERVPETRQRVVETLAGARDPATGHLLFKSVRAGEEVYHGPFVDSGPDIVLAVNDGLVLVEDKPGLLLTVHPDAIAPLPEPRGAHDDVGILLISGEVAGAEQGGSECHLADFAPTVLHLLGLPVPTFMDGRPLVEHLVGEPGTRPVATADEELPVTQASDAVFSADDEAEVLDRLQDLGYA